MSDMNKNNIKQDNSDLDSKLFCADESINNLIIEADRYSMATDDLYEKFTSSEITATEAEEQIIKTISNTTGLSDDIMDKLRVNKALPHIEDVDLLYSTTSALTGVDVEQFYDGSHEMNENPLDNFEVTYQEQTNTQTDNINECAETELIENTTLIKDITTKESYKDTPIQTCNEALNETSASIVNDEIKNTVNIDTELDRIEDMLQDVLSTTQDVLSASSEGTNIFCENVEEDTPTDTIVTDITDMDDILNKPLMLSEDIKSDHSLNSESDFESTPQYEESASLKGDNLDPDKVELGDTDINLVNTELVNIGLEGTSSEHVYIHSDTVKDNIQQFNNLEEPMEGDSDFTEGSNEFTEENVTLVENSYVTDGTLPTKAVDVIDTVDTIYSDQQNHNDDISTDTSHSKDLFSTIKSSDIKLDVNTISSDNRIKCNDNNTPLITSQLTSILEDEEPLGVIEDIPCQIKRVNDYVGEGVYSLKDDIDAEVF